jgi:RNA polymerase sigma-70 factor (ECF subfamily)
MIGKAEYEEAVAQHSNALFRYMFKLIGNKEEAENWVQEAYTILWEKRTDVDPLKIKSFLFTTAYRKMIDAFRRNQWKEKHQHEFTGNSNTDQSNYAQKQLLEVAFAQVKPEQKALIMLRDYEGYDYESISQITSLSLASVKVNLFRARKALKVILTHLLEERSIQHE